MKIDLAIIPARAGSVGLPGKNTRSLGGFPLIEWTIRAAIASGSFRRVIVSTDCPTISGISRDAHADVPFLRPPELSTSTASSSDVVAHALHELGAKGTFALLQPTSPFRSARIIQDVVELLKRRSASSVLSVVRGKPMEWALTLDRHNQIQSATQSSFTSTRRQDSSDVFYPNGAFYMRDVDAFMEDRMFAAAGALGFVMGSISSLDIDTLEDFVLAEALVAGRCVEIDSCEN